MRDMFSSPGADKVKSHCIRSGNRGLVVQKPINANHLGLKVKRDLSFC